VTRRFNFLLGSALAISVVFLGLPVVAIFTRIGPGEIVRQLGTDVATDALLLSFKTSGIALGVILLVGTPAAYFLATRRFPGRNVVITILELPLVLPPAVAGIGLFAALGSRGLLGGPLDAFGVQLAFTQAAVVVAVIFVASPFYVRQAIASFEAVDTSLLDAARTLGAGPARTFFRVSIPLAASGLAAGATLSWARGLGEFGATILFAGSLQGVTQTAPLAIYDAFSVDTRTAQALAAVLILTSLGVLLIAKALPSWKNSNSQSAYRFGRSTSS
jgi:molybdate transport system permease protein